MVTVDRAGRPTYPAKPKPKGASATPNLDTVKAWREQQR